MTSKIARTRNTSSTQRRIENMQRLVEALRQREMTSDEICAFLSFSKSGGRGYISDMRCVGALQVSGNVECNGSHMGAAIFKVNPDEEALAEAMAILAGPAAKIMAEREENRGRKSDLHKAMETEGRHFHIMADDQHYSVRVAKKPVERDSLVAALFGPAKKASVCP